MAKNILLAQELVKINHKNSSLACCAIEIDLMKAYDLVEWCFILDCVAAIGILEKCIGWIKECIASLQRLNFLLP